jgi:hypothetical protein
MTLTLIKRKLEIILKPKSAGFRIKNQQGKRGGNFIVIKESNNQENIIELTIYVPNSGIQVT